MSHNTALDWMVEIVFDQEDDFLRIKETLSRVGVASGLEKRFYPSCVILHKQGRYFISHFKLLFLLDGKTANISDEDMKRFKTIAYLIHQWGLAKILDKAKLEDCAACFDISLVKIIPFREKANWQIIEKYSVGSKRNS